MITTENLKEVLEVLNFTSKDHIFSKSYGNGVEIQVDFNEQSISYLPRDRRFKLGEYPNKDKPSSGFIIHRETTINFSENENFVCLLAIDRLLTKGYEAKHIIIEPALKVGHSNKPSFGDILVLKQDFSNLVLIENKTTDSKQSEFKKEWTNTTQNGGQLFSYYAVNKCDFLCLLTYDFDSTLRQIISTSHIIAMLDNQDFLDRQNADIDEESNKKIGFSHPSNANAEAYFNVWTNSYQQTFAKNGLLEDDIACYCVGKEKYTTDDLKIVPYNEISSIYHDFATILRHNAIGNYENTFYILVDLFLCKIVDELENPKDLQFNYKGILVDDPFSYCDRLLILYERGIKKLFNKKVINIQKGEIDRIFTEAKRYKGGKFKKDIETLFDKQKYFNIKKFNFIEVENEEEFYINFSILVQITNLIQNFYLSQSENNQFLGDLFEGFLNRSVHQTEGRFFTPMPITNFIINALPQLPQSAKILDFACGAGHFLTEFVAHNKNAKLYGIEKNKDLSKVAKTACIFHNSQDSLIIFQDALMPINKLYKDDFTPNSFDLILSNPPYSVKGFLSVLEENARKNFSLSKSVDSKSYETNNAIECFFIEKAKQFLKVGGYFALVLPVSILQKGGIYEKTREILFKHFQIFCIVELNSRTFGSTGTQTIILFAKKIERYNEDLLDAIKDSNFNIQGLKDDFVNIDLMTRYCAFMGYNEGEFKDFLQTNILGESLAQTPTFKEYLSDFNSNKPKKFKKQKLKENEKKDLFEDSKYFKTNLESKEYKRLFDDFLKSPEYKECEKALQYRYFLIEAKKVELEKMLYFSLTDEQQVLILKSPSDKTSTNKSNKANIVQFLGYDWSKRKGSEGIKYQTASSSESTKENNEEDEESQALENINSIKFIDTPLYNPSDKEDKTKLCFALRDFMTNPQSKALEYFQTQEKDSYSIFVSDLKNMIDFSKLDFNKAISLNPVKLNEAQNPISNPFANCKYELVRLGEVLKIVRGASPRPIKDFLTDDNNGINWIKIGDVGEHEKYLTKTKEKITLKGAKKSRFIKEGDFILSNSMSAGRPYISKIDGCIHDGWLLFSDFSLNLSKDFLYYILISSEAQKQFQAYATGMVVKNLQIDSVKNLQIPLPPLEIQQQIVSECEKVEEQYNTIRMSIEEYQKLIKAILVKCGICEATKLEISGGGAIIQPLAA